MKNNNKQFIKVFIFLTIGGFIFWLVYRGVDVNHIKSVLKNDVNYWWVLLSLIFGLISHISRTLRWQMLMEPLGKKPSFKNSFLAVMVGYLMNLVIPRMGEISRCGVVSKYEGMSFTKLIGTVVTERIIDIVMMLILTVFVFFAQFDHIAQFLDNNPEIKQNIINFSFSPIAISIAVIMIVGVCVFLKRSKLGIVKRINNTLRNFSDGLKTILSMKNKWLFIFHSVFIWVMYFLMLYVVFFSLDFTSHLTSMVGLTVFVMGAYGMVAPVQGGIGAWHFMVIQALMVYGIDKGDSQIFAFLAHTSMNIMIVIVGLLSLWVLPFVNKTNINTKRA